MRETEYTYAVARIRAHEKSLLSKPDIEQLIAAPGYQAAARILTDKGWAEPEGESRLDICEIQMERVWNFLKECVPDPALFEALTVANDYANLKAVLKSSFSGFDAHDYMTSPCLTDPEIIIKAVETADFRELPGYLADCAEAAYHTYTDRQSGQLTEMIIDKACNRYRFSLAQKSQSKLLCDIVTLITAVSDIKTVRRCVSTGKSRDFALEALSGSGALDSQILVDTAYSGGKLADLVKDSGLEKISEFSDSDFTSLETACDNLVTEMIRDTKYEIFGPDPVVAYFYAETAQVKNVRIILSAKASGVPAEVITGRVRELYV